MLAMGAVQEAAISAQAPRATAARGAWTKLHTTAGALHLFDARNAGRVCRINSKQSPALIWRILSAKTAPIATVTVLLRLHAPSTQIHNAS